MQKFLQYWGYSLMKMWISSGLICYEFSKFWTLNACCSISGLLAWVYSWGNLAWEWTFMQILVSFHPWSGPSYLFLLNLEACCDATIRTFVLCFMLSTSVILICHNHHHPCWVLNPQPLTPRTNSWRKKRDLQCSFICRPLRKAFFSTSQRFSVG